MVVCCSRQVPAVPYAHFQENRPSEKEEEEMGEVSNACKQSWPRKIPFGIGNRRRGEGGVLGIRGNLVARQKG
jgi:hypothetical protein